MQHAEQVASICDVYAQAAALEEAGTHVVSCDEKTGIQALERAAPTLPTRPGKDERREYEYVRHGTLCLMANLQVATGKVLAPSIGPTRSEEDFARHVEQTVVTDLSARWLFVVDNLTTHCSETLVRWVAKRRDSRAPWARRVARASSRTWRPDARSSSTWRIACGSSTRPSTARG